jgi:serine/threonine-protein kinase
MAHSGDKIGPYTLVREIGRGSFGVVWLAERRTAITTKRVALKLARDEDVDLEAFRREAAIWEQASGHPNVLPSIDADVYDGQVVIVSEYAPDGSLTNLLQQHGGRAPSVMAAVEMTLQILAGLEHLHEQQIIHRDIKPDNILLQRGTPRLTDFGLARLRQTNSHSQSVKGTPSYMAPEAFSRRRNEQTDVWSVGVVLYQMLAGHLPYDETDYEALRVAVNNLEPPPLPASIPKSLRDVVAGALQRDPLQRYKSADEMRRALLAVSREMWLPSMMSTLVIEPAVEEIQPEIKNVPSPEADIMEPANGVVGQSADVTAVEPSGDVAPQPTPISSVEPLQHTPPISAPPVSSGVLAPHLSAAEAQVVDRPPIRVIALAGLGIITVLAITITLFFNAYQTRQPHRETEDNPDAVSNKEGHSQTPTEPDPVLGGEHSVTPETSIQPIPTPSTERSVSPTPVPISTPVPNRASPVPSRTPIMASEPPQAPADDPAPAETVKEESQNAEPRGACSLTVSPNSVTIIANGGSGTVTVSAVNYTGQGAPRINPSTPAWFNIIILAESRASTDGPTARFTIISVNNKKGTFPVTFASPCGKQIINVTVR